MNWYNSKTDISVEFEKGNYEFLRDYVDNNESVVINDRIDEELSLRSVLKLGDAILKRFIQKSLLDEKLRCVFELGKLMGIVKSYAHIEYEKSKNEYSFEQANKMYGSIKHLDDIVSTLYKAGYLNQAELAKALNLKTTTLTECMKKVMVTDFVITQRVGKYKFFSLSDYGRRYHDLLETRYVELERDRTRFNAYYDRINAIMSKNKMEYPINFYRVKEQAQEFSMGNYYSNNNIISFQSKRNKRIANTNRVEGGFNENVREN